MIKFTTINVDGLEITREFKTIKALKNEYYSNDCDLPANDDEVVFAEVDGVQLHYPKTFEDLIDELGIDEKYCPSSTNGDYSPSHPWDAPGMSMRDFIR
jgi:hypothetical protein